MAPVFERRASAGVRYGLVVRPRVQERDAWCARAAVPIPFADGAVRLPATRQREGRVEGRDLSLGSEPCLGSPFRCRPALKLSRSYRKLSSAHHGQVTFNELLVTASFSLLWRCGDEKGLGEVTTELVAEMCRESVWTVEVQSCPNGSGTHKTT